MKNLLMLTLLIFLTLLYSCGDDTINNNVGNPTADFDMYIIKSKDTAFNFATYTYKNGDNGLKLFNDSLLVFSKSKNGIILLARINSLHNITAFYYSNENGNGIVQIPFQNLPDYIEISPDASEVLFAEENNAALYISNIDGTQKLLLSGSIFGAFTFPKFSPDGNRIAFLEKPASGVHGLYLINIDGTNKKLLKDSLSVMEFHSLDFSPDGSGIVYQTAIQPRNETKVCIIDTSGNNYKVLTDGINPFWSPNGDKICFLKSIGQGIYEIHLINSDGSGLTNISVNHYDYDSPGKWSADGTKIIYNGQALPNLPTLYKYDLNTGLTNVVSDSVFGYMWK